jgi:hypothetical protein
LEKTDQKIKRINESTDDSDWIIHYYHPYFQSLFSPLSLFKADFIVSPLIGFTYFYSFIFCIKIMDNYDPYFVNLLRQSEPDSNDSSRTLFVGDLSYFCTEEDLLSIFSSNCSILGSSVSNLHFFIYFLVYGPLLTVRIRRGVTGESLMHGFVALTSTDSALRAIRDLDGVEFMGRNIK